MCVCSNYNNFSQAPVTSYVYRMLLRFFNVHSFFFPFLHEVLLFYFQYYLCTQSISRSNLVWSILYIYACRHNMWFYLCAWTRMCIWKSWMRKSEREGKEEEKSKIFESENITTSRFRIKSKYNISFWAAWACSISFNRTGPIKWPIRAFRMLNTNVKPFINSQTHRDETHKHLDTIWYSAIHEALLINTWR